MKAILLVTFGYVVGSIPFAFLLSRRRGIDLRQVGSGNIGAANVLRTSGVTAGMIAVTLDGLKGSIPVVVAQALAAGSAIPVAAGVASVIGHVFPVWLRFRGGKGVATAAGVFAVLAPAALAIASIVFIATVWVTQYVSAGSIAGTIALAIAISLSTLPRSVAIGAAITTLVILYRHRGNLARIMTRNERRVGQRLF